MSPLMVLYEEGKYHIMWFNPAKLVYERVRTLNNYEELVDYACTYIRTVTNDVDIALSNIHALTYTLQKYRKTEIPQAFLRAFKDR